MNKELLDYFNGDELAASVWLSKYASDKELTPNDMHDRLAEAISKIEADYIDKEDSWGFFQSTKKKHLSPYYKSRLPLDKETIKSYLKDFKYIVPQGSIMATLGTKKIASLSNCFVVGQPEDSYGGIMQKDEELTHLMKRRGGVGLDISTLRPKGTVVTNAAKSSTGAVSFMERYSNTTREVAQDGRRGALMLTIDCRHPDVFDFVNIKKDRTKVTGANISVMLRDDFMEAVKNDDDYILRFPFDISIVDGSTIDTEYNKLYKNPVGNTYWKKIKARELYDQIVENAWENAEPGQMFIDKHWNYSPDSVYEQYKGVTTNPCGEIFMQPYDACRLIALNLFSFVKNPFTSKAEFDFGKFYGLAYEQQRIADDIVDLELFQIEDILNKLYSDPESTEVKEREIKLWTKIHQVASSGRRTGSGFTGLGDMLAALNLPYSSKKTMKFIDKLFYIKMEAELDCTTDLAILRGKFEGCNPNKEFGLYSDGTIYGKNEFYQFIAEAYPKIASKMMKFGRRNISWSTVAPTGTVSLMTQTTSGIEPLFMPFYMRRKKVNPNDKDVRIDFTDQNGDNWQEYAVIHPKFKDWIWENHKVLMLKYNKDFNLLPKDIVEDLFKESPWYGSTANDIDWIKRVELQGIIQKYTSHSISSTINLPNDITKDEVAEIYLRSFDEGLKGVTIYRDGCRTGVLVSDTSKPEEASFEYKDAPKRPKELEGEVHTTTVKGKKLNIIVGKLDGNPYEVFIDTGDNNIKGIGLVKKEKKGQYVFIKDNESYNLTGNSTDEENAVTRLVSTSLRHGADIKFIVEQLNKSDGEMFSFTKGLARVLKKYIPDGSVSTVTCEECGSDHVIFEEGCRKCLDCGNSKC